MADSSRVIIGTMIALLIYFALSPVVTASSSYNSSAGYATLWTSVFPIGIVLAGVVAIFLPALHRK